MTDEIVVEGVLEKCYGHCTCGWKCDGVATKEHSCAHTYGHDCPPIQRDFTFRGSLVRM